jgi:hypothetical protein
VIYPIIIPARDYKCLEKYLKKGFISPETMEIIGRVYEVNDDKYVITAEVLEDQAVRYTVSDGKFEAVREIRSPICYFGEFRINVMFDIDKSYE